MIALFHLCPKHLPSGHMSNKLQPEDILTLPTRQHCPPLISVKSSPPLHRGKSHSFGAILLVHWRYMNGTLILLAAYLSHNTPQYCWKQTHDGLWTCCRSVITKRRNRTGWLDPPLWPPFWFCFLKAIAPILPLRSNSKQNRNVFLKKDFCFLSSQQVFLGP